MNPWGEKTPKRSIWSTLLFLSTTLMISGWHATTTKRLKGCQEHHLITKVFLHILVFPHKHFDIFQGSKIFMHWPCPHSQSVCCSVVSKTEMKNELFYHRSTLIQGSFICLVEVSSYWAWNQQKNLIEFRVLLWGKKRKAFLIVTPSTKKNSFVQPICTVGLKNIA